MVVHVRAAAVPDNAFDVMTKAFEDAGRVGELEQHNKQLTARNGASTLTAPSNTRSTTALMEPPAANPGARVIGKNASDRTVLTSALRNQTVTIKPKGNYNQHNYTFADSFIVRMAKEGIYFFEKHGRKLGLQRHINQNWDSLQQFALKINPELITFQKKYDVILTPKDVGNWNETGVDLCAFASALYMCLKHFGNQFVALFEQSPHWTLIIGFVGVVQMELLAIMKGTDNLVPSLFHAQLLKGGDGVYLGQTATGWVNSPLKLAFANLQIDKGIIGKRPIVINVDGHDSNLNNYALHELMVANKVISLL
ncbi:hypothetical protein T492DRAFT_1110168 [Pavlovales sp. CCMP2436]|nr:hypothetical protein T492DRAFT_1110168 [Pavlovales sp. CCMP2436]